MKRLVLSLSFIGMLGTTLFADSSAEQMCQAAVMASGESWSYAIGYCRNTSYSASKWACALKYTSSGESINYALGACYDY
jgi:hypothetical protein